MSLTFWSNTIWYILLGISTIIEIIIIIVKSQNKKRVIALFCTVSGLIFSVEAAMMFLLKSYEYYPMILPQLPLDDMVAGNIFSQFSITATVVLLIAVFHKGSVKE